MNLEKLQEETARLRLEVERRQLNWESFLRRFLFSFFYLFLVLLALIFLFSATLQIIVAVGAAFLVWEIADGAKIWLELKAAKTSLRNWKQIIDSTKSAGAE